MTFDVMDDEQGSSASSQNDWSPWRSLRKPNLHSRPAPLWRFCESCTVYKCNDLLIYRHNFHLPCGCGGFF